MPAQDKPVDFNPQNRNLVSHYSLDRIVGNKSINTIKTSMKISLQKEFLISNDVPKNAKGI